MILRPYGLPGLSQGEGPLGLVDIPKFRPDMDRTGSTESGVSRFRTSIKS